MKLGFICFNLPRHLNPMTALARQLPGAQMQTIERPHADTLFIERSTH